MYDAGQRVMVHSNKVQFGPNGDLEYFPYDRPATFVSMSSKPWYPGACVVDYGNGPRKSEVAFCRPLRLRERIRESICPVKDNNGCQTALASQT